MTCEGRPRTLRCAATACVIASTACDRRPPAAYPGFWQTADALVKADGALLDGYDRMQAAKQEHEARKREAELAGARAKAEVLRQSGEMLHLPCAVSLPSSDAVVCRRSRSLAGAVRKASYGVRRVEPVTDSQRQSN